jgi:hypothetical protein
MGPASSGTRMLTEAFINVGCFGDKGHEQRLDKIDLKGAPDLIVWRRSVPHGIEWVNLKSYYDKLKVYHYELKPIMIFRDKYFTVLSQMRKSYVHSGEEAHLNIMRAINHIYNQLAKIELLPFAISYESFIDNAKIRKLFFRQFDLPEPVMDFYDGNKKY